MGTPPDVLRGMCVSGKVLPSGCFLLLACGVQLIYIVIIWEPSVSGIANETTVTKREQEFLIAALLASKRSKTMSIKTSQVWHDLGWPVGGSSLDALMISLRIKDLIYDVEPLHSGYAFKIASKIRRSSSWLVERVS